MARPNNDRWSKTARYMFRLDYIPVMSAIFGEVTSIALWFRLAHILPELDEQVIDLRPVLTRD
jgi:hypothetical protein